MEEPAALVKGHAAADDAAVAAGRQGTTETLEAQSAAPPSEPSTVAQAPQPATQAQGVSAPLPTPGLLHRLVENGDVQRVRKHITEGADVDSRHPESGSTLLMSAVDQGSMAMVQALVGLGANVNAVDPRPALSFGDATWKWQQGEEDMTFADARHGGRGTALMRAAFRGRQKLAQYLLQHSADVKAKDDQGYTALRYAVEADKPHSGTIAVLLAAGSDPNSRCEFRKTPLHALANAAPVDAGQLVLQLVKAGAEVNARSVHDETPLVLARRSPSAVKALIKSGADVNAVGGAKLHTVLQRWCSDFIDSAHDSEMEAMELLLSAGAKVDVYNQVCQRTALMMCLGSLKAMGLLLRFGADPFITNNDGMVALEVALADGEAPSIIPVLKEAMKNRVVQAHAMAKQLAEEEEQEQQRAATKKGKAKAKGGKSSSSSQAKPDAGAGSSSSRSHADAGKTQDSAGAHAVTLADAAAEVAGSGGTTVRGADGAGAPEAGLPLAPMLLHPPPAVLPSPPVEQPPVGSRHVTEQQACVQGAGVMQQVGRTLHAQQDSNSVSTPASAQLLAQPELPGSQQTPDASAVQPALPLAVQEACARRAAQSVGQAYPSTTSALPAPITPAVLVRSVSITSRPVVPTASPLLSAGPATAGSGVPAATGATAATGSTAAVRSTQSLAAPQAVSAVGANPTIRQQQQQQQQRPARLRTLDCGCEAMRNWEERVLCVVCMEKERDMALLPCLHMVLCQHCCLDIQGAANECPMCRRAIESVLKLKY